MRRTKPAWLNAAGILALLVALLTGVWKGQQALLTPQHHQSSSAAVAVLAKQPSSPLNTAELPHTPPDPRPTSCPAQPGLLEASGTWVVNWTPKSNPETSADLVDLVWLSWNGKAISEQFKPSLKQALSRQAHAFACQWRFVTLTDGSDEATRSAMAELLTSTKARNRLVVQAAELVAKQPLAHGLTLDFEFSFPTTQAEVSRLYAPRLPLAVNNGGFEQQIDYVTQGYNDLVAKLTKAMHAQGRVLRVAALVREQDRPSKTYVPPYLMDYDGLRGAADRVILMAYNHHWSTSDPGAIAPYSWVTAVWKCADDPDMPKMILALPNYGYDWVVNASGKRIGGPARIVTGGPRSGWRQVSLTDGEIRYRYTDTEGQIHEVWLPVINAKQRAAQSVTRGAPTMIWRREY